MLGTFAALAALPAQTITVRARLGPSARYVPYMAFDDSRARVVMGGGLSVQGGLDDTWEWDGRTWTQRAPTLRPVAQFAALTFVETNLVQLNSNTAMLEWNGADWRPLSPSSGPSPRAGYSFEHDRARRQAVLFGGIDPNGLVNFNDTWLWNGTRWTQATPPLSPSPRRDHEVAYDEARQRLVLYGGYDGTTIFGDTWEWDGTTWTQQLVPSPPPRRWHSMTYDAGRQRTVLFGGTTATGALDETWEWDGSQWQNVAPAVRPPPRFGAGIAFDRARGRTVVFGGNRAGLELYADTWEWDGSTWIEVAPADAPQPREAQAMAHDPARGVTVLFGGRATDSTGSRVLGDTWLWDGRAWSPQVPANAPSAREAHAMANDRFGRIILFGGRTDAGEQGDTWAWDGASWRLLTPAVSPSPRREHSMCFDSGRGVVVLFGGAIGGVMLADTWEWDGSGWVRPQPFGSPSARSDAQVAYDTAAARVVVYGGRSGGAYLGDCWAWDGAAWSALSTLNPPGPRARGAMSYDHAGRRLLVYGGMTIGNQPVDSMHELVGTTWSQLSPSLPLGPRYEHSLVWDAARQRVIGFGGRIRSIGWPSPWQWEGGALADGTARTVGSACGSSSSLITAYGAPRLGASAFALDAMRLRSFAPSVFVLAARASSSVLPGPCTLRVDVSASVSFPTIANGFGFATMGLPIPMDPALLNATLYAQLASADSTMPLGLAFTAGLVLVIGEP